VSARLAVLLLGLAAGSPTLAARTQAAPDVAELTAQARSVVHARVDSAVTVKERYEVRTTYTLTPLRTLSGARTGPLTLTLPGGRLGEVTVKSEGVPVWQPGDQAIVFLDAEGQVRLDGVLTVHEGLIVDPAERPAAQVPATLEALRAKIE